jgi:hypothetical protein
LTADPHPWATLTQLEAATLRADDVRARTSPLIKTWLMLGLAVAFTAVPTRSLRTRRWRALGWPLTVPVVAIALGAVVESAVWPWLALVAGAGWLARSPAHLRPARAGQWLFVILLAELALGPTLLRGAPLGYSLTLGARYYGIGNEWMAYLLGAALLTTTILNLQPSTLNPSSLVRSLAPFLPLGIALLALAHPAAGANLGGALTAAAALAALVGMRGGSGRRLSVCLLLLLGLALLAAAILDSYRAPADQTHLGRLAAEIREHGPAPLIQIARGKLTTNARIAGGYWGLLLACEVLACLWLLLRVQQRERPPARTTAGAPQAEQSPAPRTPPSQRQVALFLITAAAALAVNDSGVIAAALLLSLVPCALAASSGCESSVRPPP